MVPYHRASPASKYPPLSILLFLLVLIVLLQPTHAILSLLSAKNITTQPDVSLTSNTTHFAYGKPFLLRVHIKTELASPGPIPNVTQVEEYATMFFPQVDLFTNLHIRDALTKYLSKDVSKNFVYVNPVISIEAYGKKTLPKPLFKATGNNVYISELMLGIELLDGALINMEWVYTCDPNEQLVSDNHICLENNYAWIHDLTSKNLKTDIEIYVGWRGTDVNGKNLASYGILPFHLRSFGMNIL